MGKRKWTTNIGGILHNLAQFYFCLFDNKTVICAKFLWGADRTAFNLIETTVRSHQSSSYWPALWTVIKTCQVSHLVCHLALCIPEPLGQAG